MRIWSAFSFGSAVALLLGLATCGGSSGSPSCTTGKEACHCFPNSTCLTGLTCASNLCVNLGVGGAGGGAGGNEAGNAGSGGVVASTGTGGDAQSGSGGEGGSGGSGGGGGVAGVAGMNGTGSTMGVGSQAGQGGDAGFTVSAGKTGQMGGASGVPATGGGPAGAPGSGGMASGGAGGDVGSGGRASGGAGGAASADGTGGVNGCGTLIDDFEANTGYICRDNGRVGYWFSYHDAASTFWPVGTPSLPSPLSVPRGTSQRALHTYGTLVEYAGIGCSINNNQISTYIASAYSGVRFFIMGNATAPKVIVQTRATESTIYGGLCTLAPLTCAANEAPILGMQANTWTLVSVPFSSLAGGTQPFNVADVWSIEFQPGAGAFDFWIDDLSFY